jgi:hypothetical protein
VQPPVAESQAEARLPVEGTGTISGAPEQATNVDPVLLLVVAGAALGLALVLLRRKARGTRS